jgi:hypothetical protein
MSLEIASAPIVYILRASLVKFLHTLKKEKVEHGVMVILTYISSLVSSYISSSK